MRVAEGKPSTNSLKETETPTIDIFLTSKPMTTPSLKQTANNHLTNSCKQYQILKSDAGASTTYRDDSLSPTLNTTNDSSNIVQMNCSQSACNAAFKPVKFYTDRPLGCTPMKSRVCSISFLYGLIAGHCSAVQTLFSRNAPTEMVGWLAG